jgi:glucose/arabinose dehydrogenase
MTRMFRLLAGILALAGLITGCTIPGSALAPTNDPPVRPTASSTAFAATVPAATVIPTPPIVAATPTSPLIAQPTATAPAAITPVDPTSFNYSLEPVTQGFNRPTHVTSANDGSGRLFVTEQQGRIWIVRNGNRLNQPFLDIRNLVGANANEQGLLSIAFHPLYQDNGRFFVNYTDRRGDTVIAAYQVRADPGQADPESATILLQIEQPAGNHNGGMLKFGPDGYLYIGTGDGGGAGDPWETGQRRNTLLGKLLRIDVDSAEPYAIPADNPFVGVADARSEIWAWGLRNPWRFSFDRLTGDLYIADVGQNAREEVNFAAAGTPGGANYGWNIMEGDSCFRDRNCEQTGLEAPVAVYSHGVDPGGCSITGGYVYRGSAFPQIAGTYFYTDYCTGNVWALRNNGGTWTSATVGRFAINASSFGEDEAGELYLTDRDGGGLYRLVVTSP